VHWFEVADRRSPASKSHVEADSGLTSACSELTECFPILLEIANSEVVNFVPLQKAVHLHSRFETEQPAKLSGRNCV
jgi:hypothetical protein